MMESVLLLYNVALFLGLVWRHKFEPVVRKEITDGEIATGRAFGGCNISTARQQGLLLQPYDIEGLHSNEEYK